MKLSTLFVSFALTLSLFISCKKQPEIEVHEIDYLNKSEQLLKSVPVDVQLPLVVYGILTCDSLNILLAQDPKGFVFVYNEDWKLLDVFCHQGRARNEFLDRPALRSMQIFKGNDNHILLPLQDQACIKVLDLTESLISHKAVISQIRDFIPYDDTDIIVNGAQATLRTHLEYLFLDNDIYHTLEITEGFTFDFGECTAKYRIRHDTALVTLPQVLVQMEKIAGPQPEDKFMRRFHKHPNRNLIIEPFFVMDYIMFYDLDKDKSFAIHQTGYPTFDDDIEQTPHYDNEGNLMYYEEARGCFGDAVVTDSYFLVFYFGGDYSLNDENKDYPKPELMLFDWDGNFKKSVKLDTYIDAPAFDPKKKILYGTPIGQEEETILSYDLSSILTD